MQEEAGQGRCDSFSSHAGCAMSVSHPFYTHPIRSLGRCGIVTDTAGSSALGERRAVEIANRGIRVVTTAMYSHQSPYRHR